MIRLDFLLTRPGPSLSPPAPPACAASPSPSPGASCSTPPRTPPTSSAVASTAFAPPASISPPSPSNSLSPRPRRPPLRNPSTIASSPPSPKPVSRSLSPICAPSAGCAPPPSTSAWQPWPTSDASPNPPTAIALSADPPLPLLASSTLYGGREAELGSHQTARPPAHQIARSRSRAQDFTNAAIVTAASPTRWSAPRTAAN